MFLGLTADQFWDMTPRHFKALWQVYLASEERKSLRFGWLFTNYANANRDTSKRSEPYVLSDFMESVYNRPSGTEALRPAQTPNDTLAFMQMVKAAILKRDEGY